MEQTYEPMDKKRIRGIRCRASGQLTAKPISIKGTGCKSVLEVKILILQGSLDQALQKVISQRNALK